MKIIVKGKGCGKTIELIRLAAKDGYKLIVCCSKIEAHRIFQLSKDLGYKIPLPITFLEFMNGQYYSPNVKSILIDNIDMMLRRMSKVEIEAITFTKE